MAAMAQQQPPVADEADRIGDVVLGDRLRRDRLGEVWRGTGPGGEQLRVRITPPRPDPGPVIAVVDRLAELDCPTVARIVDRLVDSRGRVAVITPAGHHTLADRRRRGSLAPATIASLGALLLDGLAALHAAGLAHGAIGREAVDIDAEGRPYWQDGGLAAALGRGPSDLTAATSLDLAECAALLRELGPVPGGLADLLDPVASGSSEAVWNAVALAAAWRQAAAAAGIAVPRRDQCSPLADLTLPPPRSWRLPPLPRPARAALSLVCLLLGAAVPTVAWIEGGVGQPLAGLPDYRPRAGLSLTYRLGGQPGTTVTVDVVGEQHAGGSPALALRPVGQVGALPLGLDGTTIRLESGALVRTAAGGPVRDLREPLVPGATWSDRRTVVAGTEVVETRTILGPVSVTEPAGHFDRCIAVAVRSAATSIAGPGETGHGTVVLCPGLGLVRAHLVARSGTLDIDLVSVRRR